jgi:hypothetical protein
MASLIKQGSIQPMGTLRRAMSHPATPVKGDPVRYGEMCGTALTDEDSAGLTTMLFQPHLTEFSVKGIDGSGNIAVAAGDNLYYTDADTPPISKKATGRYIGKADEAVTSGATATIDVLVNVPR